MLILPALLLIFENAIKENSPVFIICQKDPLKEVTDISDVYSVGVIAKIKQTVKTQSGVFRVIVEPSSYYLFYRR